MDKSERIPAFLVYLLPVIGWIYVGLFQQKNSLAKFHLRQSVGLFLSLILFTLVWAIVAWLLAWIPYAFVFGVALFALPLTGYFIGVIAWVVGMVNALAGKTDPLPLIGGYSNRLPI